MPSVRLTIIVRLDQAASLDRLDDFIEVCRTTIGTDVSVLLSAADGPAATKLVNDLGALAIPFEATAAIGDTHYLAAGDGNQMSVAEAWASTPAGLADPPRRADGSVDTNRLRQYEWHCGFLDRVRGDHGPSSGMMGKDSMSSAMNIWEVQCGEVHPRGRNSRVAG